MFACEPRANRKESIIMTALTASTGATRQPRMRLTVRGRRLLTALLLAPVALGVGVGIAQVPAAIAGHQASASAESFETHTVLAGETLWSIAESIAGDDVVHEIMRLNLLDSSSLQAGQQLALPNL
jgi:LysM repeat protein